MEICTDNNKDESFILRFMIWALSESAAPLTVAHHSLFSVQVAMLRYPRPRLWKPLDPDTSTIRILHLDSTTSEGEPLSGSLQMWNLDHYPRYNAISWAWGAPGSMSSIIIDGMQGWRIPSKLELCLRRLCRATRERSFWVDAICVDQFNLEERAQQVRLMEQIFSNANVVYVWLGSEQNSLHWLPERLWGSPLEESAPKGESAEAKKFLSGKGTGAILLRDWWRRVWPMQEVILARDLKMCFSDIIMNLETLRGLMETTRLSMPQLNDLFWLADFRTRVHAEEYDKCTQFTILLHKSRLRDTSDPRDRVYGLLGICTFLFGKDFLQPDYKKSVSTVYREMTLRLVEKTASLAFLNQVVPLHHTDLLIPSWVVDLSSKYNHKPELSRLNHWSLYSASRCIDPFWSRPKQGLPEGCSGSLLCRGLDCDSVVQTLNVCDSPGGLLGGEWLRWYGVTIFSWFDAYQIWCRGFTTRPGQRRKFITTILRSINRNGDLFLNDDEAWQDFAQLCRLLTYREATTEAGRRLSHVIESSQDKWLRQMLDDMKKQNPVRLTDSSYYQDVSRWNSRFVENLEGTRFFMTDDGRIGLGPADTRIGDSVAILRGGNVPYVIRRHFDRDYSFVGECYLDGAMQGEFDARRHQVADFYLH